MTETTPIPTTPTPTAPVAPATIGATTIGTTGTLSPVPLPSEIPAKPTAAAVATASNLTLIAKVEALIEKVETTFEADEPKVQGFVSKYWPIVAALAIVGVAHIFHL